MPEVYEFSPELPRQLSKESGGGVATTIGKIIITLVILGAAVTTLPLVFCFAGMLIASAAGTALGIIGGGTAAILVLILAGYLIKKIFKHKER